MVKIKFKVESVMHKSEDVMAGRCKRSEVKLGCADYRSLGPCEEIDKGMGLTLLFNEKEDADLFKVGSIVDVDIYPAGYVTAH